MSGTCQSMCQECLDICPNTVINYSAIYMCPTLQQTFSTHPLEHTYNLCGSIQIKILIFIQWLASINIYTRYRQAIPQQNNVHSVDLCNCNEVAKEYHAWMLAIFGDHIY